MFCSACRRQTSPSAGTILHNSRVPLRSWFLAMWLACTQKTGLSAKGLQRELGLGSYQTAWLMLQKLRQAMFGWDGNGWAEVSRSTRLTWAARRSTFAGESLWAKPWLWLRWNWKAAEWGGSVCAMSPTHRARVWWVL